MNLTIINSYRKSTNNTRNTRNRTYIKYLQYKKRNTT